MKRKMFVKFDTHKVFVNFPFSLTSPWTLTWRQPYLLNQFWWIMSILFVLGILICKCLQKMLTTPLKKILVNLVLAQLQLQLFNLFWKVMVYSTVLLAVTFLHKLFIKNTQNYTIKKLEKSFTKPDKYDVHIDTAISASSI